MAGVNPEYDADNVEFKKQSQGKSIRIADRSKSIRIADRKTDANGTQYSVIYDCDMGKMIAPSGKEACIDPRDKKSADGQVISYSTPEEQQMLNRKIMLAVRGFSQACKLEGKDANKEIAFMYGKNGLKRVDKNDGTSESVVSCLTDEDYMNAYAHIHNHPAGGGACRNGCYHGWPSMIDALSLASQNYNLGRIRARWKQTASDKIDIYIFDCYSGDVIRVDGKTGEVRYVNEDGSEMYKGIPVQDNQGHYWEINLDNSLERLKSIDSEDAFIRLMNDKAFAHSGFYPNPDLWRSLTNLVSTYPHAVSKVAGRIDAGTVVSGDNMREACYAKLERLLDGVIKSCERILASGQGRLSQHQIEELNEVVAEIDRLRREKNRLLCELNCSDQERMRIDRELGAAALKKSSQAQRLLEEFERRGLLDASDIPNIRDAAEATKAAESGAMARGESRNIAIDMSKFESLVEKKLALLRKALDQGKTLDNRHSLLLEINAVTKEIWVESLRLDKDFEKQTAGLSPDEKIALMSKQMKAKRIRR